MTFHSGGLKDENDIKSDALEPIFHLPRITQAKVLQDHLLTEPQDENRPTDANKRTPMVPKA